MPEYDFRTLSSYDFEILARDLLQAEFQTRVESFRQGRDQGIDLRFAESPRGGFIAQCKHFGGSGLAKLASHLASSERAKVERLSPPRYLLVTSVSLTPANKQELLGILQPYCHGPHDIFGKEDLNNLLGRHPEVERQHFKLWLSSTTVLDRLLHSQIYTQTELALDEIQEKMCRYVENESFREALTILDELHYCVICGIPGIGKTMLADMLLVSLIGSGYEAIKVASSVDEALHVFKKGKPQVFYYDDFLGQTSLHEQKLAKNEDQQLLMLLDRVRHSDKHRFLLTTREYILNQAKSHYERLDTSRFDVRRCTVTLDKYTLRNRCRILFNHLYFSRLPHRYIDALLDSGAHRAIVRHRNFSPRTVEQMTVVLSDLPPTAEYGREFLKNLDQPLRLWDHAYSRQLSEPAQVLLLVLGTMDSEVLLRDAERAFAAVYPSPHNDLPALRANVFTSALKELDGTFVTSSKDTKGTIVLAFQNPSIRDFVEHKLRLDGATARSMLRRAVFFDQVLRVAKVMEFSPALRGSLDDWADAVCAAATRTLDSDGCIVRQVRYNSFKAPPLFETHRDTVESRVSSLLDTVEDYPPTAVRPHVDHLLFRMTADWHVGRIDAEHAEYVLDSIAASAHISGQAKQEIARLCGAALIEGDGEPALFTACADLWKSGKVPAPSAEERERLIGKFLDALDWMLDRSNCSDRSAFEQAIDEAEGIAESLGVDITDELERARDRGAYMREEQYPSADEPRVGEVSRRTAGEDLTDGDIDEMFAALK
jgi:hypothetical protein